MKLQNQLKTAKDSHNQRFLACGRLIKLLYTQFKNIGQIDLEVLQK